MSRVGMLPLVVAVLAVLGYTLGWVYVGVCTLLFLAMMRQRHRLDQYHARFRKR